MMAQNLRGEMCSEIAGAQLCLSDSRFIQVVAKSLSVSCKEVRAPAREGSVLMCMLFTKVFTKECRHCSYSGY